MSADSRRRVLIAGALLVLATVIAYMPALRGGFVGLDDDAYVYAAPMVKDGLRAPAVVWAFTAIHTANWHPFTSLSHMLDCELFGVNPTPMHVENVLLHALNALLVFAVWRTLTGTFWRALAVAGLFALHPLHVESVAWISSRKDLVCTLFWLLGIAAYLRWVRAPSFGRYTLVTLALAAALMAKPMAVTFPCTLLLLDAWPLGRWRPRSAWQLVREKWPLFTLVVLHSVITFAVQDSSGAANYARRIALDDRLGNAAVAYARYLGKTFWPETLAPLYFHPGGWPFLTIAASLALLAAITFVAWRQRTARPWLGFGWCWFLGTLVPAIGLIQVGAQSMADRYTYVPLLGVFTILAWASAELIARTPGARAAFAAATALVLLACGVFTWRQAGVWRDTGTLFRHSIAVGEDNAAVRYLLGTASIADGRPEAEVAAEFQRAVALEPDYVNAHTQLASLAAQRGNFAEARRILEQNLRFEPHNPVLHFNLAVLAGMEGRTDESLRRYEEVLRLDPKSSGAHHAVAQSLARQNRLVEARAHYDVIARVDRWNPKMLTEYGILLANLRDYTASRRSLERALWIDPKFEHARENLAKLEQVQAQTRR